MNYKEVALVKSARPDLAAAVEAAKRGDAPAARAALRAYDFLWNGVEVYISTRSRPLYQEIEIECQRKIEELLAAPSPNFAEIVPLAERMLAGYDQAIKNAETGPAINLLFDDVADIRLAQQGLRAAASALKAGDPATARAGIADFQQAWPGVRDRLRQRAAEATQAIEDALTKSDAQGSATATELGALVDTLLGKYNAARTPLVAEARAAGA